MDKMVYWSWEPVWKAWCQYEGKSLSWTSLPSEALGTNSTPDLSELVAGLKTPAMDALAAKGRELIEIEAAKAAEGPGTG